MTLFLCSFSIPDGEFFLCGLNYYNVWTQLGMCILPLFQAKQNEKLQDRYSYFLNFACLILWLFCLILWLFCTCPFHQILNRSHIQNMTVRLHEVYFGQEKRKSENTLRTEWDSHEVTYIWKLQNNILDEPCLIMKTFCSVYFLWFKTCFLFLSSSEAESTVTLCSNVE